MRNLQTAWEAIEKGDRVEAQSLVAQILRDDPRNAEAWMVLGEAVSGERQVLFLRKALQLNPDLTLARTRLAQLETAEATETIAQEEASGVPTIPPDVSLDAPTIPITERLNANRSSPQNTRPSQANANKDFSKKSNASNTVMLFILGLAILVVLFFLIQSIPG